MADDAGAELEGRYSNSFRVGFNAYEFVIDFGQQYDDGPSRTHTRIVTSAGSARGLCELLATSLREHDAKYAESEPGK
jgi:hypothetical protein